MAMDFARKRVLVIGGETPLGRAIVVGLAECGADVAIASLTPDTKAEFAINSALNELWAIGRKGHALAIDASDADRVRSAVARFEDELGPIDIAAVIQSEHFALDALTGALHERDVVELEPATNADEALSVLSDRLR
jgi:NAD(P)-dependent dehydrogenase (short-subunit alcohol dehydrogenase family)